ncbi:TIGR03087 family PEP-CTERM/XrtA system glycosyltransferase [Myxococcota bacterium]|nr:TIGR03087 family PEP-CTERM/XrtA system glycosyltransferase [Myxococcota bacterium]
MSPLLFLCQRLPFPPNKGEKIRYFHFLRHLATRWDVHLGCFIDDPADWDHVPTVRGHVRDLRAVGLDPRLARALCTRGVLQRAPLSVTYFGSRKLRAWVEHVCATVRPEVALVGSSSMGQYLLDLPARLRPPVIVTDFVDVDSEKWRAYAEKARLPMKAVYAREQATLLRYDRRLGALSDAGLFVTPAEVELFARLAPELAPKLTAVENGVDAEYFDPAFAAAAPSPHGVAPTLVFTGHMDYWPNVDAVLHFADDVLPRVRAAVPDVQFCVVGANPVPEVRALAERPGITVTGRVPDVRPYVTHATVCVAPLRIARGLQNKVLEAMACARPVVVSPQALEGIDCTPGRDLLLAGEPTAFASACVELLQAPARAGAMGAAARALVVDRYSWASKMGRLDETIARATDAAAGRRRDPPRQGV